MERRRPIMKLLHPAALFLTFVLTAGSAVAFAAPDLTEALKKDGGGPAAYLHQFDQKDSPYYVHPDFYRMKSHGSLLLLSHYRTHQQETEYTCGPAAHLRSLTIILANRLIVKWKSPASWKRIRGEWKM